LQYVTSDVTPNGDRPVVASGKINTSVKNANGQYETKLKEVEFWPDGKFYVINENGKYDTGSWKLDANGNVEIVPGSDKFKGSTIKG
jgi:hypothetical protein